MHSELKSQPRSCRLGERLLKLKQSGILTDVTVLYNDSLAIHAHKCILSASSLYFKTIFTNSNEAGSSTVDLSRKTVHSGYIDTVVEFMYTGCVTLSGSNLVGIVGLASVLECPDLLEICADFVDGVTNMEICFELYVALHQLFVGSKKDRTVERIMSKLWNTVEDEVLQDQILKLSTDSMASLLCCDEANCLHRCEAKFLRLATRWLYTQKDWSPVKVVEALTNTIIQGMKQQTYDMKNCAFGLLEVLKKKQLTVPSVNTLIAKLEKHTSSYQSKDLEGLSRSGAVPRVVFQSENINKDISSFQSKDLEGLLGSGAVSPVVFQSEKPGKDTKHETHEECSDNIDHYDSDTDDMEDITENLNKISRLDNNVKRSRSVHDKSSTKRLYDSQALAKTMATSSFITEVSGICDNGVQSSANSVKEEPKLDDDLSKDERSTEIDDDSKPSGFESSSIPVLGGFQSSSIPVLGDFESSSIQVLGDFESSSIQVFGSSLNYKNRCIGILDENGQNKNADIPKLYLCTLCNQRFDKVKSLDSHMITHRAHQRANSKISNPKLASSNDKIDKKVFRCEHCDKTFTRKAGYQKHVLIHTGEKPFSCGECGAGFKTKYTLKLHRHKVHTGLVGTGYKCEECGFKFCDKTNFDEHVKACEGKKLACQTCGKKFLYQVELDRHLVSHSDARTHVCDQCPRRFKHVQNLKAHVQLKHQNVDKVTCQSICDQCGKVLKNRNCLRRHLLTHAAERPHKCPHCPKSYTQSTGLEVHMRLHTGDKPYQCEICSEMFVIKCNLERHIQRHVGDKPHKCTVCDKAFVQFTDLKRHQTVHTGEKKFSCRFCGKLFALKKSIPVHERIHTGDRPYKCTTCRKSFLTRSDLKRHEKVHLKNKLNTRLKGATAESLMGNSRSSRLGIPPIVNFMETYPAMDIVGLQTVPVPRNDTCVPSESTRPFIPPFSSGISFY